MKMNIGNFLMELRDTIAEDYNYSMQVMEHTVVVYIGEFEDLGVEYDADKDEFAPLYIDDNVMKQGLGLGDAEAVVKVYQLMKKYRGIIKDFVEGGNEDE